MLDHTSCAALDASDPLAPLRLEFELADDVIYLDGNSLGAMPRAALKRAQEVIRQEWGKDLIRSWNKAGWFEMPSRLGDKLANLIGAKKGEVVVTDSTSINLFKTLAAGLHIQQQDPKTASRRVIVSERGNFPTDLYIAQGLTSWLDRGYRVQLVDSPEQLLEAINDTTAVVMLTHVNYRTGYLHDMHAITAHAHAKGAIMVWDLAHSAGAVPVDLNTCGADFAVGCGYKYLNGGPGAPAFIWIPERHQAHFQHPLSGWWGHKAPFDMHHDFSPTAGIRRALCGTQPIVSLALVECGLDIFAKTNMQAIRTKSLALTDLFIDLVEQECSQYKLSLVTPRAHAQRGSQVSLEHEHGYAIMQALIARNVVGDYREPNVMRFGFTPLYTRYIDVWNAVATLKDILSRNAYNHSEQRAAVT